MTTTDDVREVIGSRRWTRGRVAFYERHIAKLEGMLAAAE